LVLSTREGNQIATDSRKGRGAERLELAAEADGNGRDRAVFWRDRVLAETALESIISSRGLLAEHKVGH